MSLTELPHNHGEGPKTELIREQLNDIEHFQTVAEVFKQLGDATRIRIFWLLCHREECVLNISAMLEMSSPAVSHHLRPLKNSGLIVARRDGKEVHYRAADTEQSRLLHQMIEQVMEITCPELLLLPADTDRTCEKQAAELSPEQLRIVREIHDHLLLHMERRTTIEELARQYLINPTTLKADFKSVYGTSLAAHVKEHRMEQAARLLRESDMSIAEIAQAVGYDSQSKFTVAFKSFFQTLPRDYRKKTQ
ncbi:MAG: metalloregulator ArsR/SmtB family transcription factor [Lachnospiraceae bacterium]|nr:metalloregulator ArsR/SmtB family transcription factor [Lachnospiraceae bacterium]